MVVGWRNAVFLEEQPQAVPFSFNAAHERTRLILLVPVQTDETNEPCVEHVPLAHTGRMFRHAAKQPQLLERPSSGSGQRRI